MENRFPSRLRLAMERAGLRQADLLRLCAPLCAEAGVKLNKGDLSQYLKGVISPRADKRAILCRALNVTEGWLLGYDDSPRPRGPEEPPLLPAGAECVDLAAYHAIPIVGRIAAGLPIFAAENVEGYTLTDLNGGAEYFALRVRGDSMDLLGIRDGCLIIVRRQPRVENGEIAVCMVGTEGATVKRFYAAGRTVTLVPQSSNPGHHPQVYDLKETEVTVLGKVVKAEIEF